MEQEEHDEEQLREYKQLRMKAAVSLIAGSVAMLLSMPLMSVSNASGMERVKDPLMSWNMRVLDPVLRRVLPWMYEMNANAVRWLLLAIAAFIAVWSGRRFYTKAWSALLHKTAVYEYAGGAWNRGRISLFRGKHRSSWIFFIAWCCSRCLF